MKKICKDNAYPTTIHAVNSLIIKISKLTVAQKVYRGFTYAKLPDSIWTRNETGVRCGIECGCGRTRPHPPSSDRSHPHTRHPAVEQPSPSHKGSPMHLRPYVAQMWQVRLLVDDHRALGRGALRHGPRRDDL
eukprot:2538115-Prymnesium_polylepis.1